MADPLGLIGGAGGVRPVPPPPAPGGPGAPGGPAEGPSFKDVLLANLKQVNQLQRDATRAMEDLQTGKRDDVEQVMLATRQADTAFRMLQQVRNKMLDAYEEMKQMRV